MNTITEEVIKKTAGMHFARAKDKGSTEWLERLEYYLRERHWEEITLLIGMPLRLEIEHLAAITHPDIADEDDLDSMSSYYYGTSLDDEIEEITHAMFLMIIKGNPEQYKFADDWRDLVHQVFSIQLRLF